MKEVKSKSVFEKEELDIGIVNLISFLEISPLSEFFQKK